MNHTLFKIIAIIPILYLCACSTAPMRSISSPNDRQGSTVGDTSLGNGGWGIVCKDQYGDITSAEILDLYDGRMKGLNYISAFVENEYRSEGVNPIHLYHTKITELPFKEFAEYIDGYLNIKSKSLRMIAIKLESEKYLISDQEQFLKLSNDAIFEFPISKNCYPQQIAKFEKDSLGNERVYILEEYWNKLNSLNKYALMIHEAIYKFRRDNYGDDNSFNTMKIVGYIMASDSDKKKLFRTMYGIEELFYIPLGGQESWDSGNIAVGNKHRVLVNAYLTNDTYEGGDVVYFADEVRRISISCDDDYKVNNNYLKIKESPGRSYFYSYRHCLEAKELVRLMKAGVYNRIVFRYPVGESSSVKRVVAYTR